MERINPVSPDDPIPEGVWDADIVFEELRRRAEIGAPQLRRRELWAPKRRRLGWAVALASASAVLLLIGGAAWMGRVLGSAEDLPVVDQIEEPVIEEPAESDEPPAEGNSEGEANGLLEDLPADVVSGTLNTPIGQAEWVHVTGNGTTLPLYGEVVEWPSGFAILEPFSPFGGDRTRTRLWVSTDGIDWNEHPLPISPDVWTASLTLSMACTG